MVVDVERRQQLWLELREVAGPVAPRWINEKLLFVRVPWGRIASSDLIVDVESGAVVWQEAAWDGGIAWQQFRGACAGQCPCAAEPGSAATLPAPPMHLPAAGEPTDPAALVGRLAYLDADWDGRVFTRPGEGVYTRSTLAASPRTDEVPADVLQVVEAGGAAWLEVALYERGPCDALPGLPPPEPVHRGWVPAYSAAGRLVAGSWPGGC